jgi:hypothetical protein
VKLWPHLNPHLNQRICWFIGEGNQSDQSYNFYGSIHLFLGGAKNPGVIRRSEIEKYLQNCREDSQGVSEIEKKLILITFFCAENTRCFCINYLGYEDPKGKVHSSYSLKKNKADGKI